MKVNVNDLAVDERRIVLVASDSKYVENIEQTNLKMVNTHPRTTVPRIGTRHGFGSLCRPEREGLR